MKCLYEFDCWTGCMDELTLSSMSIQVMVSPTLDEVAREIQIWKPEIIYFCSYSVTQADKNIMVGPLAFEVMVPNLKKLSLHQLWRFLTGRLISALFPIGLRHQYGRPNSSSKFGCRSIRCEALASETGSFLVSVCCALSETDLHRRSQFWRFGKRSLWHWRTVRHILARNTRYRPSGPLFQALLFHLALYKYLEEGCGCEFGA